MVLFEKINGYWRDGWIREFVNKEVLKIIYMYVYIQFLRFKLESCIFDIVKMMNSK